MTAPVLDLAAGSPLVLDGAEWIVEQLEPQYGNVVLARGDGQRMRVSVRFLISHPDCRPSSRSAAAAAAADRGRQPKTVQDLSPRQRELTYLRLAHLLEAETGFSDALFHGEAVGLRLAVALHLSGRQGHAAAAGGRFRLMGDEEDVEGGNC